MQTVNNGRSPAASTRIMAALGVNPNSQRLLDAAQRLAQGLDGDLLVVHIHQPSNRASVYQANLGWHIEYAKEIGAHVEILEGKDIASTLVSYAQGQGVTHLVLGQSEVSRWREIRRGSLVNQILRQIARRSAGIDLYIVTALQA
jgi:two-component system sensor histidine kinase KdpD